MGIFSFFGKRKTYFTPKETELILDAIRNAERQTSGEIRIFIESKNYLVSTIERAAEIFYHLKMEKTEHRNAVLLYLAMDHHEVALFGDEGIHQQVGSAYWENEVAAMLKLFKEHDMANGIANCVTHIGATLKEKFPYEATTDKNELPDEIVFGR
ncbi:MAG: TPM domain-containing protein [Chitinophagaceae bacterium]|nr:TPM domain-containing protein [Chitinophagaceae bacterium]